MKILDLEKLIKENFDFITPGAKMRRINKKFISLFGEEVFVKPFSFKIPFTKKKFVLGTGYSKEVFKPLSQKEIENILMSNSLIKEEINPGEAVNEVISSEFDVSNEDYDGREFWYIFQKKTDGKGDIRYEPSLRWYGNY